MKSVALCAVVYNEINRIKDLVYNAYDAGVDEVCIVDQQSTDGTWEWLESEVTPGLKVAQDIHHGFCEPSRVLAHNMSAADWILVLDADEEISADFHNEMYSLPENIWGVRLKRALFIAGDHRFTGDYQYRFFHKDAVNYLPVLHTEPQPTVSENSIYYPDYVGIIHSKSWTEQIRDELAYEALVGTPKDENDIAKLELNVHLKLLREKGITAQEADDMTSEDRKLYGLSQ